MADQNVCVSVPNGTTPHAMIDSQSTAGSHPRSYARDIASHQVRVNSKVGRTEEQDAECVLPAPSRVYHVNAVTLWRTLLTSAALSDAEQHLAEVAGRGQSGGVWEAINHLTI